jgi:hypothetical protein
MQALEENRLELLQLHLSDANHAYPRPYENLMKLRIVGLLLAVGMVLAACAPKAGSGGGAQATPTPTSTPAGGGGMDY